MTALHDSDCSTHPGCQSLLNFLISPVSDDNFSLDSHAGNDMSILSSTMSGLVLLLTILQVLSGLALTVIVLMQSGKSAGLSGSISGGADTFLSKGKAKTLDAKLARWTKWFALAFVLLTLVLHFV